MRVHGGAAAAGAVREQDGRRFLHAASRGIGIQAAKQFEWDLTAYPVLAWSWRPIEFPKGSDERKSATNDSALSVYAVFPNTPWSVKSVKYIWSAVAPVGTHVRGAPRAITRTSASANGSRYEHAMGEAQ